MNYRHLFHAGNFADVFKHVLLSQVITALKQKETPFFYMDSHAGEGVYDLHQIVIKSQPEYLNGIARLFAQTSSPVEMSSYLELVKALNAEVTIPHPNKPPPRYYPGSPFIAAKLMRPQDRLVACEWQALAYAQLKKSLGGNKQCAVHHRDGYAALKAFLPPKENRGLVLIDPPFEDKQEITLLVDALTDTWRRWPNGIYALWLPIKGEGNIRKFYRRLQETAIPKMLVAEFTIARQDNALLFCGCSLVLINPPYQIDTIFQSLLAYLQPCLAQDSQGGYQIYWLVP